jgi:hypothetical protein
MAYRYGDLNETLVEITGNIVCSPPQRFKILVTGEIQSRVEQDSTPPYFFRESCRRGRRRPIEGTDGLPEATYLLPEFIDRGRIGPDPS